MQAFRHISGGLLLAGAVLAVLLPAAMAAPAAAAPAATVQVTDAQLRLPVISGRPGGGFFTMHGGAAADALVAVTSPRIERIELHQTTNTNGVMSMAAQQSVEVPAGATVAFAPRGRHLMLFGVASDVKPGDKVPLTFRFKSGAQVTVDAVAQSMAGAGSGMHHQH